MKINFEYFQIQKSRWKNGIICLVSMFSSWVMVLKLSKKVHFLQFCADLSKRSRSVRTIYTYASERSRYALSENGLVYYAMTYCFGDISVWNWRILLNFCWVNIFWYFNHYYPMSGGLEPYKSYYFLKEGNENLDFLLRSVQNCKNALFE